MLGAAASIWVTAAVADVLVGWQRDAGHGSPAADSACGIQLPKSTAYAALPALRRGAVGVDAHAHAAALWVLWDLGLAMGAPKLDAPPTGPGAAASTTWVVPW